MDSVRIDTAMDLFDSPDGELDRRLRGLSWPGPPQAVKERGLEAIMRVAMKPAPPAIRVERVQRFEVTRWRPALRTVAWSAPRRPARFAISL